MTNNIYSEIREIKAYALDHNVPIMVDEGMDFLTTFVTKNQVESVLEIGTAIGYSAIMMALANPNLRITTIEKDEERYLEALKNVKKLGLESRITLIFNDALEVSINETFDLIFIDAAKGQNLKYFDHFEKNLNEKGYIITDNIGFHGYVEKNEDEIKSKNLRSLVHKIKDYILFLENNVKYKTIFHKVGDGIAVTQRR